jgi:hypothetical protein
VPPMKGCPVAHALNGHTKCAVLCAHPADPLYALSTHALKALQPFVEFLPHRVQCTVCG